MRSMTACLMMASLLGVACAEIDEDEELYTPSESEYRPAGIGIERACSDYTDYSSSGPCLWQWSCNTCGGCNSPVLMTKNSVCDGGQGPYDG